MNKRLIGRLVLDGLLVVMFLCLSEIEWLGSAGHEFVGLAAGGLTLVHLWVERRSLSALLRRFAQKKTPLKLRLTVLVDSLLIICLAACLIAGIGSSVTLLVQVQLPNPVVAVHFHESISYVMFILIGVHIWQHRHWLKGAGRAVKNGIKRR